MRLVSPSAIAFNKSPTKKRSETKNCSGEGVGLSCVCGRSGRLTQALGCLRMAIAIRVVVAALVVPAIWVAILALLYYRPEEHVVASGFGPTAPHLPSTAPFVYNLSLLFCGWFYVLFMPVALVLLRRGKAGFATLCVVGGCVGGLAAGACAFFFIGMGVHGAGIVWLPAIALMLREICVGAVFGAAVAATFALFVRVKNGD